VLNGDVPALHIPEGTQRSPEDFDVRRGKGLGGAKEESDPVDLRRLRLGSERRGEEGERASDERSSIHYSMISSARANTDCGIVRPRALAVLRLMTSSNFVGCSTGRSAGLAPLRILST